MTRLKALLKKADKAAVIGMTAAAVAMATLGAGGVKTYASDYSVQKYVDSSKESLILDGDTWHCYKDGQIDYEYDGIALNDYGWWKINNGEVDFSYSGMVLNQYGWWYVNNGGLDGSYSNMGVNEYGWWKFDNGTVDFNYSGIASNEYGWWKFVNGSIDFSANGLNFDEATNTWWYFNGGVIDFSFDGMALNDYGWWKVNNGSVNFGFDGLCSNEYGTWKFNGGTVDFGYTGFATDGENTWYVVEGRVATDYNGTVDGKTVRNGQVVDPNVIIPATGHSWKNEGPIRMDWQYAGGPDDAGHTNTYAYVSDVILCGTCNYYLGADANEEIFAERYWKHFFEDAVEENGSYTVVPVYAVFDLLECTECGRYKRGDFAFYEYWPSNDEKDRVVLNETQIKELGLVPGQDKEY